MSATTVIQGIEHAIQIVEEGIKTVQATGLADDIKKALEYVSDYVISIHEMKDAAATETATVQSSNPLETISKTLILMNAHFSNLDILLNAQTEAITLIQKMLFQMQTKQKTEPMQQ